MISVSSETDNALFELIASNLSLVGSATAFNAASKFSKFRTSINDDRAKRNKCGSLGVLAIISNFVDMLICYIILSKTKSFLRKLVTRTLGFLANKHSLGLVQHK